MNHSTDSDNAPGVTIDVGLSMTAERRLIRPHGSSRHVYFHIKVGETPPAKPPERAALTLALVLDRSGSMSGDKLATAKAAALAVLDRLGSQDRAAVVVFDDRIDVLQPVTPVTSDVKAHVRAALGEVQARSSTALHEGWLRGCQAIAADGPSAGGAGLSRCFLLTDGLANVGQTDPEAIASEAAGIRERAGIGTSTFGVGPDYDEALLGPMAVAGGGQFHHLRTAADIADTFLGELNELLAVAARNVRLELALEPGAGIEIVSAYWRPPQAIAAQSVSIAIGDLLAREERDLVIRVTFPARAMQGKQSVRARLVWQAGGSEQQGGWTEVEFSYADDQACSAEARDPLVMHWVGLHLSDQAVLEAARMSKSGDIARARETLRATYERVIPFAGADPELRAKAEQLHAMTREIADAPFSSLRGKDLHYQAQRASRGQRDHLRPDPSLPSGGPNWFGAGSNLNEKARAAETVNRGLRAAVDWPQSLPANLATATLQDHYRGCLIGGAIGDALGRAGAGMNPDAIRARFGSEGITNYVPWRGWHGGPTGTHTGATELTVAVAQTLFASPARFDAEDFGRRLIAWLPGARSKGQSTAAAVEALAKGAPWWIAGLSGNSAGSGAAMRVAPVGLARALYPTPWQLRRDAVLSAFPTHTHPMGVGAAVALAAGVAWCLREAQAGPKRLDPQAFVDFVVLTLAGTEPEATMERRPGGKAVRLSERIAEIPGQLRQPPAEAFAYLRNGAFALEAVPVAIYCFLRTPEEPRQTILLAVNAGYDSGTVASMAGSLAGAWNGAARLRQQEPAWWAELEDRDGLAALADGLLEVALKYTGDDRSDLGI